jgi:gamma-glutamyltranspeptidase/glutathione hydrolase
MNPVLVFDVLPNGQTGSLQMSLGSPGGAAIIHYTTQTLLALLHSKLWAQDAINLPHLGVLSPNGPVYAERGMFSTAQSDVLEQKGHRLIEVDLSSGIQALQRTPKGWHGGADPRREGWVMGQ